MASEKRINITVRDRIAKADRTVYICGNSDFTIKFDFDAEWQEYATKTARFHSDDGTYIDVVFDGDVCTVPVLSNIYNFKVGVFAGNLRTTTPALVSAKKSILCGSGVPAAPPDDVYSQIMELLNSAFKRIEALEKGAIIQPVDTSAVLGVAILDKMVLA